ncbi:hypothetical protein MY3296_008964 [Beauveria thailandica]
MYMYLQEILPNGNKHTGNLLIKSSWENSEIGSASLASGPNEKKD